ncbi:histamine H2 receptor-like [Patiria miniata]|uniref:G-protein coupled receptors family 1 profile domain-containing protein n=1 Tax=Patiria miniata TaxID=46514 RepID=A0A914B8H9_PATMI|nr:histamine H2 receptor-like [Patiria miniata]XP_038071728.1 histamine H2 receptor-like [Patiria miniata]
MNASDIITGARYALTGIAAVATVENLLVLVVFACTSRLRMKYYGFLINLTLADLFYAVMAIAFTWGGSEILFSIFISGYFVGVWTILAEGINRYLAVSFVDTARYDVLVTRNRLVAVCVLIWVVSVAIHVLLAILPDSDFESNFDGVIKPVTVFVFWLITAVLYIVVFRKIKGYTTRLESSPSLETSCIEEQVSTRVRQTRRLLVTFTLILITSFICWMPLSVMNMVAHIHRDLEYQNAVFWLTGTVYCVAPMINPWIYWMLVPGFREGSRQMFCRCFNREVPAGDETVLETGM